MRRSAIILCVLIVTLGVLLLAKHHRDHSAPIPAAALPPLPRAFPTAMPGRVLWAWEEPEDLRTLPATTGVAYLAETVFIGDRLTFVPRRQPLQTAPDAPVMAVVRIETRSGFHDTPELRVNLAAHLAAVARRSPVRALQIDFDATASQRGFYIALLDALRPQLPRDLPLSITALVSWCGDGSWLHRLPIDEAVPMYFRMGGPRALTAAASRPGYAVTEPLCRTSVGVSTDEPWPRTVSTADTTSRVYLFASAPWQQQQLAAVAATPLSTLRQELVR